MNNFFLYFKTLFKYYVRTVRITYGFLWNLRALVSLPHPIVTVFGSAKTKDTADLYYQAYALGRMLAEQNISVITGGGPGIMHAANCGAASVDLQLRNKVKRTLGITVRGIDETFDPSPIPTINFHYFFMRKWFLSQFSSAFIVFPGGIGTMDELFDVLNLRKHDFLPLLPVVLIGKDYWQPLLNWFNQSALAGGEIEEKNLKLFIVTDSIEEAFHLVSQACKDHPRT